VGDVASTGKIDRVFSLCEPGEFGVGGRGGECVPVLVPCPLCLDDGDTDEPDEPDPKAFTTLNFVDTDRILFFVPEEAVCEPGEFEAGGC